MKVDFYDIFYYGCLLLAAITGLWYFKKADTVFKGIAILILLTLISELIAKYIAFGLNKPNSIVYHLFTPVEYTIYVIIFQGFLDHKKWNTLLWLSAIGLFLFEIVNTIFFQSLSVTNTNVMITESVLLVFLSLMLFLKIRETPSIGNLLKEGVFWFNSAVLCYYAFNSLIWGFHNMKVYTLENPPQVIYDLNLILSGLLYLSFSTAIILNSFAMRSIVKKHV